MKNNLFKKNISEHLDLVSKLIGLDVSITTVGKSLVDCLNKSGKIMLCGNGGSAADSQHLAAELTGRFISDRRPLSALALSTDTSALTSIGNDYSFDEIFARQIIALGRSGDVLIAISTSGNSRNVIRAVEEANKLGMMTIGLIGRDGGQLLGLCNQSIVIPSNVTARIQECHILIGHTLCGLIEQELGLT